MTAGMLARERGALDRSRPDADGAPTPVGAPLPSKARPLEWFRPAKLSADGRYDPVGRAVYAGSLWWLRPRDRGVRQAAGELARLANADWVVHCRREPEQYALGWLSDAALKGPPVAFAAARGLARTIGGTFQGVWPVVAHDGATAWWCLRVVDGRVLTEGDRVYRSEAAARRWFDDVPPELTASMTRYAPEAWKLEGAIPEPLPSLLSTNKAPRVETAQRRSAGRALPLLRWAAVAGGVVAAYQGWQHWTADLSHFMPPSAPRPFPMVDASPRPLRSDGEEAHPQAVPSPSPSPPQSGDVGPVDAVAPAAPPRVEIPPSAGTNLTNAEGRRPPLIASPPADPSPEPGAPLPAMAKPSVRADDRDTVPALVSPAAPPSRPLDPATPSPPLSAPRPAQTGESSVGIQAPQMAAQPAPVLSRTSEPAIGSNVAESPLTRRAEPTPAIPDAAVGPTAVTGPSRVVRNLEPSASAPAPSVVLADCMTALGRTYANVPGWTLLELTCSVSPSGLTAAALYKQDRRGDVEVIRAAFQDAAVDFDLASGNARVWQQAALVGQRSHAELWTMSELRPRLRTVSARVAIDMSADSQAAQPSGSAEGEVRSIPVSVTSPLSPRQIAGALDSIPGFRILRVGRAFPEAGKPASSGTASWTIVGATDVRRN